MDAEGQHRIDLENAQIDQCRARLAEPGVSAYETKALLASIASCEKRIAKEISDYATYLEDRRRTEALMNQDWSKIA